MTYADKINIAKNYSWTIQPRKMGDAEVHAFRAALGLPVTGVAKPEFGSLSDGDVVVLVRAEQVKLYELGENNITSYFASVETADTEVVGGNVSLFTEGDGLGASYYAAAWDHIPRMHEAAHEAGFASLKDAITALI